MTPMVRLYVRGGSVLACLLPLCCSTNSDQQSLPQNTVGGSASAGDASSGGSASGGPSSGGNAASGGTLGIAGNTASGGTLGIAGNTAGGATTGGNSSGGDASGGTASAGASAGGSSGGAAVAGSGGGGIGGGTGNTFTEPFDTFDKNVWSCEYTCPTVSGGFAQFNLLAGIAPNNTGSWSKIRYKPRRFTAGKFSVRFSLGARPSHAVWWGVALWDDGPSADQFNEINFGYTTDESFTNTQLLFESTKRGQGVSLKIDAGVDLYDGSYHVGQLEYDSSHVAFYFDGKLMKTITDTSVIPTDAMDLIIGPRLVTGAAPLSADFTESADWAEIQW